MYIKKPQLIFKYHVFKNFISDIGIMGYVSTYSNACLFDPLILKR